MDVDVTLPASLLEASLSASNVLSLRLRSLHSLPDAWQPGAFPFTFTAALPLPLSPTNEQQQLATPPGVVVPNGVLKLGPDKDASCLSSHWKWPVLPSAVGKVGVVSDGPIEPRPLEDEVGEFNSKQVSKTKITCTCTCVLYCTNNISVYGRTCTGTCTVFRMLNLHDCRIPLL